jgi:hypothetical protein
VRGSVKLVAEDGCFILTLTTPQRGAVRYATDVVEDLPAPDPVVEVMFGAPRQTVVETGRRLDTEEPTPVTLSEIRLLYQMLKTLPECFGSEESFNVRTGYYRENFIELAQGLLGKVEKISHPPEG